MEGLVKFSVSGEAGAVVALYNYFCDHALRGPNGEVLHAPKLKKNTDGVTAGLRMEAPVAFFDVILGEGWRETDPVGGNVPDRYTYNYRGRK